jgi:glycosyltransferase involved in cell wall biosynthesis
LIVIGPEEDAGNWAPWVEHRSGLDDAGVAELLVTAGVLCAPSTYEGFGVPAFEALSAGVTVVATSNPGSRYLHGGELPEEAIRLCESDSELVAALVTTLGMRGMWGEATQCCVARRLSQLREAGSPSRLLNLYRQVNAGV